MHLSALDSLASAPKLAMAQFSLPPPQLSIALSLSRLQVNVACPTCRAQLGLSWAHQAHAVGLLHKGVVALEPLKEVLREGLAPKPTTSAPSGQLSGARKTEKRFPGQPEAGLRSQNHSNLEGCLSKSGSETTGWEKFNQLRCNLPSCKPSERGWQGWMSDSLRRSCRVGQKLDGTRRRKASKNHRGMEPE